jgi:hypothetical protein
VKEEGILHTEHAFSEYSLVELSMELKDVSYQYDNVPYAIGCPMLMPRGDIETRLATAGVTPEKISNVIDLLL